MWIVMCGLMGLIKWGKLIMEWIRMALRGKRVGIRLEC